MITGRVPAIGRQYISKLNFSDLIKVNLNFRQFWFKDAARWLVDVPRVDATIAECSEFAKLALFLIIRHGERVRFQAENFD